MRGGRLQLAGKARGSRSAWLLRNPGGGMECQCGLPRVPCAVSFLINTAMGGKRPRLPIRPWRPPGGGVWGGGLGPSGAGAGPEQRPPPSAPPPPPPPRPAPREWLLQRGQRSLPLAQSAPGRLLSLYVGIGTPALPWGTPFWCATPHPSFLPTALLRAGCVCVCICRGGDTSSAGQLPHSCSAQAGGDFG